MEKIPSYVGKGKKTVKLNVDQYMEDHDMNEASKNNGDVNAKDYGHGERYNISSDEESDYDNDGDVMVTVGSKRKIGERSTFENTNKGINTYSVFQPLNESIESQIESARIKSDRECSLVETCSEELKRMGVLEIEKDDPFVVKSMRYARARSNAEVFSSLVNINNKRGIFFKDANV